MSAWLSLTRRLNVRAHGCTRCTECSTGHCPMCYECPNKQKNELQGVMGKWAPYGHIPGDGNAIMQAIDALRDAITSRDRHFDALAEQLRQGFEAQITHQDANEMRIALARDLHLGQMEELRELVSSGKQHVINTILNSHETFRAELASANEWAVNVSERLKVLGAQLEVIEQQLETVVHQLARLGLFDVIAARLTAIEAQLTESKRPSRKAGKRKAKR